MLRIIFPIASILLCIAPFTVSAQAAGLKLYCAAVTTELGWSGTLPYTFQMCPLDAGSCDADKRSYSLQPESGRADSGTHCWFADEPVKFFIGYNADYSGGRDDVVQELVPIEFDWRGLYPDVWCLEDAAAYFTDIDGKLGLRAGYFRNVKRQKCTWNAPNDSSLPPPNSDLPAELVGSWVPKGKECPGFFDDASRADDVLWVQPHAIERASDACLLTGLFPLTPTLAVDTLCQTARGDKRTTFTFDRMDGDTMRLREDRGRRVTYQHCEKTWLSSPKQREAAAKLKGQTLSFILEIHARMREVKSRKTVDGSHTRKIELRVGDDGRLTDRMQIGDAAAPKTFTTHFGDIAIDTDGDRATWRVEDGKLKRVRERKGYYEILSWPLNFDSRSVACEAEMKLVPTRSDGRLRTVGTDKLEYDIINAGIKSQRCPTEPLAFAVGVADKKKVPSADECIKHVVETIKQDQIRAYNIVVENTCEFDIVVRLEGRGDPDITALPASATARAPLFPYRNFDPEEFDRSMTYSALTAEEYKRNCGKLDFSDDNMDAALACFGKAYVAKHGEPDWAKDAKTAGGCVDADPDIAIKACTADIEAGKATANTLNNRAFAYMEKGQYDLALADLDNAIERDPKHDSALNNRGIVWMKKGEYRRAIEDFSKAIDLTTIEELRPYRQRAEAYAALGRHDEAIKDADEALKIDPDDDKARAVREASMKKRKAKSDECLVHKFRKSAGAEGRYDLMLVNDCNFPIAAMAYGQTKTTLIKIVSVLDANPMGADTDLSVYSYWTIKFAPNESPQDVLKEIEFGAVTNSAFANACGDIKKLSSADQIRCFRKLHAGDAASAPSRQAKPDETDAKSRRFDIYENIHIRHILLNSESDAELAAKVLKGGADFAQTAKSLSIDEATAAKGGDLGWVGIGTLVKEFEDAAFALKPGEVSAPVKTQFGWHIIKLEEARSQ